MMDLQSTPLIDTTIKPNSMCQSSSSLLPSSSSSSSSPNNLLNQCNNLIKEAKNFNLHANVLKQLLNLKDRASGYEIYARRQSVETINTINSTTSSGKETSINLTNKCNNQQSIETLESTTIESIDLENLLETIKKLSDEVIESHRLGFCLAYNIQCLHKRLTGSPIDLHSSANMIRKLQEKYDSFKTREAILKYEFQEKRKLLRRLRSQLEETREDWRVLRVTKRRPERRAERNENDDENDIPDDDALWSETLRRQFASKRKQPSEESGFIETNNRGEGVEVSSSPSSTSSSTSDDNQGTSSGTTSDQPTKITRTTGYEDLAIALDNRRAKLDYLEDECYNLFQTLSARSTATVTANDNYTNNNNNLNNQLNGSTTIPIVSPLLFSDDLTDDQLLLDDDDDEDEDEEEIDDDDDDDDEVDENEDGVDELSDPLSDEFDELNLPVDTLDPIDATEEIDASDLPWDSNNLYESRATSLVTTDSHNQMSPNNLQNNQMTQDDEGNQSTANLPSSLTLSQSNMVHIGVGMDDDDDDEYTQQEMESLAETGEPLVLCRLRRRAVEILISRLRDEKILHQSRESELTEQLDKLRRLNDSLTLKLNNLKSNDWSLRSTGQLNSILITSMVTLFTASVFVYFFK